MNRFSRDTSGSLAWLVEGSFVGPVLAFGALGIWPMPLYFMLVGASTAWTTTNAVLGPDLIWVVPSIFLILLQIAWGVVVHLPSSDAKGAAVSRALWFVALLLSIAGAGLFGLRKLAIWLL